MTKLDDMNRAAADVVRARKLTRPEHGEELCTMLRRLISGLSPEQADKALVECSSARSKSATK